MVRFGWWLVVGGISNAEVDNAALLFFSHGMASPFLVHVMSVLGTGTCPPYISWLFSALLVVFPLFFWRILHNTFLPFCLLQKIIILLILVKLYTINHSAYYPRQCAILCLIYLTNNSAY